jgi:hypothetical protein
MTFTCSVCEYTTTRGFNLRRHIERHHNTTDSKTDSHGPQTVPSGPQTVPSGPQTVPSGPQTVPANTTCTGDHTNDIKKFVCETCESSFSRSVHLKRHMARCKGTASTLECPSCHHVFACRTTLWRHKKDGCASTINHITNNHHIDNHTGNRIEHSNINSHNHVTINVHINTFGQENVEHITAEIARKCLEMGVHGVMPMVDKIFFDPNHPENHNVHVASLKHSIADVKTMDGWKKEGLDYTIDKMLDKSSQQILCKATPDLSTCDLSAENVVTQISSIQNIKPHAKKKLRERTKARLLERRDMDKASMEGNTIISV